MARQADPKGQANQTRPRKSFRKQATPGEKARAELAKAIDLETGKPRCVARSKNTGERCTKPPVPGTTVCRWHGGMAPQTKRKAALRLMELVDPAISTLAREMVNQNATAGERIRAAENILDRTGYPRKTEVDTETAKMQLLFRLHQAREQAEQDNDDDDETPARQAPDDV